MHVSLSVLWVMLPRSMEVKSCLGSKSHVTLITGIAEHVREMLTLHMVSCTGTNFMRKLPTNCAVKLPIIWVLFHKLKKFTGILKIIS